MNRVGEEGKGESVWLGWFLLKTLGDFAPHRARRRATPSARKAWDKHADSAEAGAGERRPGTASGIAAAAMTTARRSARAIPTNARSIRSPSRGACCRATAIRRARARRWRRRPSSWSTTSSRSSSCSRRPSRHAEGAGLHQELSAGRAREWRPIYPCRDLVRHRAGRNGHGRRSLALLLDAQSGQPCARREGGRTLSRRALCRRGRYLFGGDKGGRGGWTWYTGSAGWLYRAAVESILGIRKEGDRLTVKPVLPSHWDGYSGHAATFRTRSTGSKCAAKKASEPAIEIDGERAPGSEIELETAPAKSTFSVFDTCDRLMPKIITKLACRLPFFCRKLPFFLNSQIVRRSRDVTSVAFFVRQTGTERIGPHCKAIAQPVRHLHGAVHNFYMTR